MAEAAQTLAGTLTGRSLPDLAVHLDESLQLATVRYFSVDGAFAAAVREATGVTLPETQAASGTVDGQMIFAWRSPTETLCLAQSAAPLAALAARLGAASDGCLIDLTGGLKVLRVQGARVGALLRRLGGTASVPRAGESRRSRLAEVPVQTIGLPATPGSAEVLLIVDRAYAPHLLGWIRETLADFA